MGAVVLDSSVVIGFFRPDDTYHGPAGLELARIRERGDTFVLAATVLAESLVGSYRQGEHQAAELRRRIIGLFGPARHVDEAVALQTARLRARHRSLRLPDALVIATGIIDDATVLTCDQRLAGVGALVQVIGAD